MNQINIPSSTSPKELGRRGEMLCSTFLQAKGWNILERNLNSPYGEVDIICERQGCLWAVEVKTRHSIDDNMLPGIISSYQKRRIVRSLLWYAEEYRQASQLGVYLAIIDMEKFTLKIVQLPVN